ncbi:anthranilate synthase component I [Natranaerofaba carboxydovora]|uniref:anthranilate synthase component I n=1 Tax=Natranaerofaba carboxydovora TaxID=2742683 RepID=UPI001F14029F|nr:anthranilate synthase component I [Natranaerofaba carboxydovora]UMZ72603.1 Anthranilate synthase component 1 [Natranaerofaba carboxydovora]
MVSPNFEEFKNLAENYRIVPIYISEVADRETPITIYEKLKEENPVFLLESGMGREKLARYSFVGCDPFMAFESYSDEVIITQNGAKTRQKTNPLTALKELYKEYTSPQLEDLPRFFGGGVGYFGYEMINFIEENKSFSKSQEDRLETPDISLLFPNFVMIYDHLFHKHTGVLNIDVKGLSVDELKKTYYEKVDRLKEIMKKATTNEIKNNPQDAEDVVKENKSKTKMSNNSSDRNFIQSFYSPEKFKEDVKKAKDYILEGDIFQVVLSRCLEIELDRTSWDIYRVLRTVNPSPYMYYMDFEEFSVVGASPEMLVRQEGRDVYTRPIAGTRPRGKNEKEDQKLADDLVNDPKERAEHLMLIDLGRNDIGKISSYGSVKVTEEFGIENFSHVMHMVSEVQGEVDESYDMIDVLKACFPAGTVSGAPKIRAMEIIDELEPVKRGPYSGGVGYMAFNGNMDVALTIRTLVIKDNKGFIQAGAGIVADSVPEKEYQETLSKAKALLKVIEKAHGGESLDIGIG